MAAQMAAENRRFLRTALDYVLAQGITEYIDLGAGLPTPLVVHEIIRWHSPSAAVAYVDNDPVVLGHLHALAAKGDDRITEVAAGQHVRHGAGHPVRLAAPGGTQPLPGRCRLVAAGAGVSDALARLAAVEAARGSFEAAHAAITGRCGPVMGKRQAGQAVVSAACDIVAFYAGRVPVPATASTLLVISADAKGIAMRPGALRPATARAAAFRARKSSRACGPSGPLLGWNITDPGPAARGFVALLSDGFPPPPARSSTSTACSRQGRLNSPRPRACAQRSGSVSADRDAEQSLPSPVGPSAGHRVDGPARNSAPTQSRMTTRAGPERQALKKAHRAGLGTSAAALIPGRAHPARKQQRQGGMPAYRTLPDPAPTARRESATPRYRTAVPPEPGTVPQDHVDHLTGHTEFDVHATEVSQTGTVSTTVVGRAAGAADGR